MSAIPAAAQRPNPPSGAELLVATLERLGVEVVFGYPGGAIMPVYDALPQARLRHVLVRHEQAASFAADGYARITGKPGVCMATSGPGATNLITGIANAFLDNVPMLAITGQVSTAAMGTDAFQEVDTFGMTLPIVKHSLIVRRPEDVPAAVEEAYTIAGSGRPGPVLLDLPKDVAAARTTCDPSRARDFQRRAPAPEPVALAAAAKLIGEAERPLLYIGYGVTLAGAEGALRRFVERTDIPAVASLKGLGALPTDHPAFLGMLGMHGLKAANLAVERCDLLIAVGARFDDRATGKPSGFAPGARVLHLDIDPAEISKVRRADVSILGDLSAALDGLDAPRAPASWRAQTADLKQTCAWRYDAPGDGIYAPALLKALSEAAGDRFVAACDVGQHQMWAAQHCRFAHSRAHLTSGGLGAMGYGLPAALGAQLGDPAATVVAITGDGSFMMNIQELATIRRLGAPVKILLLDNSQLGLVRQWQDLFYAGNQSEIDLSDNPDFAAVAEAFGIEAFSISRREEVPAAIARLLAARGPILAHVRIDPAANVWPLVPPGACNAEMMEEPQ